ncbi:MAG TPA: DUF664 domain-containing protein [Acidimicrobiia bacterium]|nr:DUF664 domain-containing protein [Acidimicrobiia bacterium]
MISVPDYLVFVDEALDGMTTIVLDLGDERANQRLDVPGSNSAFALLTHCLGVLEYWGGAFIAGRPVERDRDAEFRASGAVTGLVDRARRGRRQFEQDLASFDPVAPPPPTVLEGHLRAWPEDADLPLAKTQGGVLIHVYDELARHRGQMETIRDVLAASWAQVV